MVRGWLASLRHPHTPIRISACSGAAAIAYTSLMVSALRYAFALVLFAAFGLGLMALNNWLKGTNHPLWFGPIVVAILLAMTMLIRWCRGRGLITSPFFAGGDDLARREQHLSNERIRIIADAKRPKA